MCGCTSMCFEIYASICVLEYVGLYAQKRLVILS